MPNKRLFASRRGESAPQADAVNEAGGVAYSLPAKHALAQYAATGCLNQTFYARAETQLTRVMELCAEVDTEFIAQCAVYSREQGYMKDMPALLMAILFAGDDSDREHCERLFPRVIDNGRMLRGFVQIVRSGVTGRKSFGRIGKRMIRNWLASRTDEQLFRDSVGQNPSLADIIKMVHPKPETPSRCALYGYLLGREHNMADLTTLVQDYELYKGDKGGRVPNVPFQMLTGIDDLPDDVWKTICRNARWMMTRMNLNTFQTHGVFGTENEPDQEMIELVANRLRDPDEVRSAKAFPYQLMAAYMYAKADVPFAIRDALQDAMDIAVENVPEIPGNIYVCPDVSGSMGWAVTGSRPGATTSMCCVHISALVAAAVLRKNPTARVLPFEGRVRAIDLNPRDSVMTNASKLADLLSNGTRLSAPLELINEKKWPVDAVILVSDNESWMEGGTGYGGTGAMKEWETIKARCPDAKLVCIDIQPYETSQFKEKSRDDILEIGGFSDVVFKVAADFINGEADWVEMIESSVDL